MILKYEISRKSVQRELSCSRAGTERQTDRRADATKLIVAFRNFANARNTSPEAQSAHDRTFIPSGHVGSMG